MVRRSNTGKDMILSGEWIKAGRKGGKPIYEHISGGRIEYDCMAWSWRVNDKLTGPLLWVALLEFQEAA